MQEWKTRERQKWVEIAGRNQYGEQKFLFFNILVESSIGLVYTSVLQQLIN